MNNIYLYLTTLKSDGYLKTIHNTKHVSVDKLQPEGISGSFNKAINVVCLVQKKKLSIA